MSTFYTLSDLRGQVLQQLDEAGALTTDSTFLLTNNFINQAQQARLAQERWPFMRWEPPETFTVSSATRYYALHQEYWRPDYFFNQTTNAYLIETPGRQLASTVARWNTDSGHVLRFRMANRQQVAAQPTSSSQITIVSSAAGDTTAAKAITLRGVTSNGVTTESLTPSGTTPIVSVNSYTRLLAVTKGAAWVGNMTMTSNAGAVTNLFLFPGEFGRNYQMIETLVTPSGPDIIEYSFYRQPTKLVADTDIPDIPPPHSQILVWDACILFTGYITDLNQASVKMWTAMEESMEQSMKQAFVEGLAMESEPRYVRYIAGDEGSAPFVRST